MRGIKVLNCPSYNSQAVAEHAIGLIFAVSRKIIQAHISILNGAYKPQEFLGVEVEGKLLVTVGYGNIGKRIIKMAEGLGMKSDYINSKTTSQEIDEKIKKADILVLCLPLTAKTKNIIDKKRLSLLKKNAIVINVARGLVVDQKALYQALKKNKITGAGIDTFAKDETITKARKDILDFAKLQNVVATPHMAFNTKEAAERLGNELISNINSCFKNKPINVVN